MKKSYRITALAATLALTGTLWLGTASGFGMGSSSRQYDGNYGPGYGYGPQYGYGRGYDYGRGYQPGPYGRDAQQQPQQSNDSGSRAGMGSRSEHGNEPPASYGYGRGGRFDYGPRWGGYPHAPYGYGPGGRQDYGPENRGNDQGDDSSSGSGFGMGSRSHRYRPYGYGPEYGYPGDNRGGGFGMGGD